MKICFIIRDLGCGGAERQVVVLANELATQGHEIIVVTLYGGGIREHDLQLDRVRLVDLKKTSRADILGPMWRLNRLVRRERPDIVHGYLSAGNLAAACTRLTNRSARIFWGIRDSDMQPKRYGYMSRICSGLATRLSFLADRVIVNSRAGLEYSAQRGYPRRKLMLIPNGIDTEEFRPDPEAGNRVRAELQIAAGEQLVGLIGRLDPMKDHASFLRAAAIVRRARRNTRFICVAGGSAALLESLQGLAAKLGISGVVIWSPPRCDMRAVYNALDLVCSSSCYGEGFPNVIGEGMACGRPCVVTDVGDSADLTGDTAIVVPRGNSERLAAAIIHQLESASDGSEARRRICERFSVALLANRTQAAMMDELPQKTRPARVESAAG